MDEKSVSIEIPLADQKSIQPLLNILEGYPYGIPGLPKIISPKVIASRIQAAMLLSINEGSDGQSKAIGVVVAQTVDETNNCGSFSLFFDQQSVKEAEIIDAAIKQIKLYYQKKGLTKLTLLLTESDGIIAKIAKNNGFIEEAVLQSQIRQRGGFLDIHLFSVANGDRAVKPLTEEESVINPIKEGYLTLGKNDMKVLEIVSGHPEGIKQREIIKIISEEAGDSASVSSIQTSVSSSARKLAEMGLAINEKAGRERLVKPKMEEIRNRFPEFLKEIKETEKVPEVKAAPEEANAKFNLSGETSEEISDSFTKEEDGLLESLSDKQIEKGIDLVGSAIKNKQEIRLAELGSKCGVGKERVVILLQALIKIRNIKIKKRSPGIMIGKITVNDSLDYEQKTAKFEPRKEIT